MPAKSVVQTSVVRISDEGMEHADDALAVEEPLEIRIEYGPAGHRRIQGVSVTMRTPGADAELALGFLFTEGIISSRSEVLNVETDLMSCTEFKDNIILVRLAQDAVPNLQKADRNFYTTSSCGVCGKASIGAIRTLAKTDSVIAPATTPAPSVLNMLPAVLQKHQQVFSSTGGLHASALFSATGELLIIKEDVGRHNALDKLIGTVVHKELSDLQNCILLLSGRASFELIQKAAMAGIRTVAAIGAPSSLAVELAGECGITLIGFLRNNRFNIYTGKEISDISCHLSDHEAFLTDDRDRRKGWSTVI